MEIQFKPVPVGDMAGALAHFIKGYVPDDLDKVAKQNPKLIILYDDGVETPDIVTLRNKTNAPIALVTRIPLVQTSWHAVDRVVLVTDLNRYVGVPANEIHFQWKPGDNTYPVVAPLGAQQTHIYATTDKGNFSSLVEWASKAPYSIGVIPRVL